MEIIETVTLKKEHLLKAFKEASDSEKTLLKKLYPAQFTPVKITDRVKTFEDACQELGMEWNEHDVENHTPDEVAHRKIKIVIKALNEDWIPDWNNANQKKWAPWFKMDNPGFRFRGSYCGWTAARSGGGSRLCLKSEELSDYIGNQFLDMYKDFLA